jgi:hypothetical protein
MMTPPAQTSPPLAQEWLDLQSAASVEVTSEDADFPIESALVQQKKEGGGLLRREFRRFG